MPVKPFTDFRFSSRPILLFLNGWHVNYDEKNNHFCQLEDVYFHEDGEEVEVLDSSFKGQIMEYVLLTSDGTIIRTVSLDKSHEATDKWIKIIQAESLLCFRGCNTRS